MNKANSQVANPLSNVNPSDTSIDDILEAIEGMSTKSAGSSGVGSTTRLYINKPDLLSFIACGVKVPAQLMSIITLMLNIEKGKYKKDEITTTSEFNMDLIVKPYVMRKLTSTNRQPVVNDPSTFPDLYLKDQSVNPDNKALDLNTWSGVGGNAYVQNVSKVMGTYRLFLLGNTTRIATTGTVHTPVKYNIISRTPK